MRRKMKKYLVILTAGIWAIGIKPNMVMAQDFTETMKHETEDELTADYVETGICVLENHGNFASAQLSLLFLRQLYNIIAIQQDFAVSNFSFRSGQ